MFQLHVFTTAVVVAVQQSSAMRSQMASTIDLNVTDDELTAAGTSYNHLEASRYARFARATYCYGRLEEWACGATCRGYPLHGSDRDRYAGFVAKRASPAPGEPTCIVAMRGSDRWENLVWDNLNVVPHTIHKWDDRCKGCIFHKGFFDAYDALQQEMFDLLDRLDCNTVGVTGHSLGGALASLAAFDIRTKTPGRVVRPVYTFGAPRVGNQAWVTAFKVAAEKQGVQPAAWRIVHHTDGVPGLPPFVDVWFLVNYRHTPQEVWYTADYSSHSLCGSVTDGEDLTCSRGLTCNDDLVGFTYLIPHVTLPTKLWDRMFVRRRRSLRHAVAAQDCNMFRQIEYHTNVMNIGQDDACDNPLE